MTNHKVKWVEHNGKKGSKTFPSVKGRAVVESFRKQKGSDPKVKDAWIEWGSLPNIKRK